MNSWSCEIYFKVSAHRLSVKCGIPFIVGMCFVAQAPFYDICVQGLVLLAF
jgi:hypothetical protein